MCAKRTSAIFLIVGEPGSLKFRCGSVDRCSLSEAKRLCIYQP